MESLTLMFASLSYGNAWSYGQHIKFKVKDPYSVFRNDLFDLFVAQDSP